jgi:hypothetical protein
MISALDEEKKKIKKMSFLRQDSRSTPPQEIKIHPISVTPVTLFSSWADFLQTCGFDLRTLGEYVAKFGKVKFDPNRVKVIDSNILDKIGVADLNHQLMILERIEHIKSLETAHLIETKFNKLISALNEEAKRRNEGNLLSSSGGSLPSSNSLIVQSNSSSDLASGMKSPLHRSNKDNNIVLGNSNNNNNTNSPALISQGHGHGRNSSIGNMIV